jgi:hypothetical protein
MKYEYVYLLYEGNDIFKIGRTSNIHNRLKPYKTHSSNIEGYLAIFEVKDSKLSESRLHYFYKDYKKNGEFFELPIDELRIMESKIVGLKKSYLSQQYIEFTSLS